MVRYGKEGDPEAFDILLSRYREQIFGFLIRSSRDRSVAEDLYQETFVRVIRAAPDYKPSAKFRTWIFTIARNLLRIIPAHRQNAISFIRPGRLRRRSQHRGSRRTINPPVRRRRRSTMRSELSFRWPLILSLLSSVKCFYCARPRDWISRKPLRQPRCSVNTAKSRMRYALLKLRDGCNRPDSSRKGSFNHEMLEISEIDDRVDIRRNFAQR